MLMPFLPPLSLCNAVPCSVTREGDYAECGGFSGKSAECWGRRDATAAAAGVNGGQGRWKQMGGGGRTRGCARVAGTGLPL